MKYFLALMLLAAVAGAQETAASSPSLPVDQENSRKARMLLDQAIQALGGQSYLDIRDISQEGRSYSFHHGQPNSLGILFWRFYKFPDKERTELTKQRDVTYIINGDKGYEITFKGTALEDPKDLADVLRRRHYSLDWVLRKWLHEPGIALFYEGPTVAERKPVEQVSIMNAKNEGVTLYISADDYLPVKKSYSWRDPTDKERNVEEEVFDNYRLVQGIMTPYTVTRFYNGDMAGQRFLTSVTYNQGLSDSKFQAQPTYNQKPR
jgi:hypothetical protein